MEEYGAEGGETGGDDVVGGFVDGPDGPGEGCVWRLSVRIWVE